ncbi:MAG: hypothetical protein H7305_08895 [Gemmatimonadaceae bacterium]|nr:hypothetical protein [Gemmatimonadaceae bacterium]
MCRVGAAALVLALGGLAFTRATRASAVAAPAAAAHRGGYTDRAERDVQIAVWNTALVADPASALVLGQLAALHLQRGREGGTFDEYVEAERLARRSLARRTNRNSGTAATLISALLAQHRFTDARMVAVDLVAREPDVPEYRAALAEVAMELGDDVAADTLFRSVWASRGTLTIAARLARWLEINDHVPEARTLLMSAQADAMQRRDVAMETKAWFALRVGDLELRRGHLRAAEAAYTKGLVLEPDDPRLFAAMARLARERQRYDDVIRWGERAIGMQLDPATLGMVGDAYAMQGNAEKADEYFRTLEVAVSMQPGAYHRAWSLYLLDHGLRVNEVLRRAQDELRVRKDVYGYDVVAWALLKAGRGDEARAAMRAALRLKTPDPLLLRHARAMGLDVTSAQSEA